MEAAAERIHIAADHRGHPRSDRVILADGADAERARRDGEIELSHWVPNRTAERYKADTSTEICLRYVADPEHERVGLAVNDHVDVDGILSLYVLRHPDLALAHRHTLVGAAEMGDFLAWAERPGFVLAQELWRAVTTRAASALDGRSRYELGFGVVTDLLAGHRQESPDTTAGWRCVEAGLSLLDEGVVATTLASARLVSFVFPPSIDRFRALGVPALNQLVDDSIAVWPQVRNRDHGQRLQLLSAPASDGGWFHDLWAPSYCWAETPGRWALPGLVSTGDSNRLIVSDPALTGAVATLQSLEPGGGRWACADELTPFDALDGRRFPVLVSCVDSDGGPHASALSPDEVVEILVPVWASGTDDS